MVLLSKGAMVRIALLGVSASGALGQMPLSAQQPRGVGPDGCGRADPAYIHTANETGGIPMFLERSEAAKAFHLVRESTRNNMATVFWATGSLGGKTQMIEIPVDSMTQRITFTFSVDTKGGTLVLKRPSGRVVSEEAGRTEITELSCGRIVTVASPEAGNWRAEVASTGTFWMEVQAQSDIYFINVEFVKEGGRIGHEGLFRIQGQPLAGTPATLQASLSAAATETAEFYLVSERGETIEQLRMRQEGEDRTFLEFVGSVDLPKVPFRMAVEGRDSHGARYQRFFAGLFHAETVEVAPQLEFDEVAPGTTRQAVFTVRNIGPARTFKVTVTDARQFVSRVEPKELTLGSGESAVVHVDLTVPAGTASGVEDHVVVVAASTSGTNTSNSSVVRISVPSSQQGGNSR